MRDTQSERHEILTVAPPCLETCSSGLLLSRRTRHRPLTASTTRLYAIWSSRKKIRTVYMDIYERGEPEMQYLSAHATRVQEPHTMVTPTEQRHEPRLALVSSMATTPINVVVLDFTHTNEQGLHRFHAPAGRRRQFHRLVR